VSCHPKPPTSWLTPFILIILMILARNGRAADAPILSMKRVSFATGADHKWYADGARGWQAGVFGAYNVTPHASLVGSSVYDLNAKGLEHRVGIRIRIFQGKTQ
jgi:hypothetical protein